MYSAEKRSRPDHRVVGENDLHLWKMDAVLRRLEGRLDKLRLVSLDLFDTLIFRACAEPSDVFEAAAVFATEQGVFHRPTSPAEFRSLRIAAERMARKRERTGTGEVTLETIYEQMPAGLGDMEQMAAIELVTEREMCWLNPNVLSLIRYCNSRGIVVAALSDMYLSANALTSILTANGLGDARIDAVLVSSERGCGKGSGGLFDCLLNQFPEFQPEQIVHIGDHEVKDVAGAAKRGIAALHYDLIPETIDSPFHWEKIRHGRVLPEIESLRKLAGATEIVPIDQDERFFYRFGAEMLGPFVQAFCDWVLDRCVATGRSEVHPLMREAHLLGPALERAAGMRGLAIRVKPLFVSRQATLLASMSDFTMREMDSVLALGSITIGEVLTLLGADADVPAELAAHADLPVPAARVERIGRTSFDAASPAGTHHPETERTVYDVLRDFLQTDRVRMTARETMVVQRRMLLDHIRQQCACPDRLLTVDLGFHGTIQAAIDTAYDLEGIVRDSVHLLAVGTERSAELLMSGTDLRCWIGGGGENGDLAKRFARSPGLIEELSMGEFGSTVRYERRENGEVFPVLAQLSIPSVQFRWKRACQNGVNAFQRHYGDWKTMKPQFVPRADPREWCKTLHRVLDMPTPEEAERLGDLVHQDNFGGVQTVRLCDPLPFDWESGGGDYLIDLGSFGPKTADLFWPQGTLTRSMPYHLYRSFLRQRDSYGSAVIAFQTMNRLKREGIADCILVGSGGFADLLVREAQLQRIRIAGIVKTPEDLVAAAGEEVFVLGTLTDIEEYRQMIVDGCARLNPNAAPRLFEPRASNGEKNGEPI